MAGASNNLCVVLAIAVVALYVGSWAKAETNDHPSNRQSFKGLQVNLIRREYSLSLAQRLRRAIERSNYRQRRFQSFITQSARFGVSKSYFSPVNYGGGEFIMQASIGSPNPMNLNFNADTGSDLIWTQCQPCQSCFAQPYPLYDPAHSSSYQDVSCNSNFCSDVSGGCDIRQSCAYSYSYGDGSYTYGNLSFDTFSLPIVGSSQWAHFPRIAFGCGRSQSGVFNDWTGIVGLGRGPLSFVSQIRSSINSVFSYCLGSIYNSSQVSPLILGNVSLDSSGNPLSVTPLIYNSFFPTFYYLSLDGISVGGKSVPIPKGTFDIRLDGSGGLIIDSGTTLSYLPDPAYKPFLASLRSGTRGEEVDGSDTGLDLCYKATPDLRLPVITFEFAGDATYTLPVKNAFVFKYEANGELACLAFASAGPPGSLGILGNIQQQNFQIAYDLGNNKLSFREKYCASN